ncbi:hypothetical protein [Microvirga vignae]|nr:hypothetical protein [Microvirga vignae]
MPQICVDKNRNVAKLTETANHPAYLSDIGAGLIVRRVLDEPHQRREA